MKLPLLKNSILWSWYVVLPFLMVGAVCAEFDFETEKTVQ